MMGLGCSGFAAAVGLVGGGDLLEVVYVVDEAAFDLVHAGVDIAGDGDVDEEHGAVTAALEEVSAVGAGEDLLRRAGASDDDVGAAACSWSFSNGITPVVTEEFRNSAAIFSARDSVRFETRMLPAPCWMRWRAANSDILPAPTRRMVLPWREPKILRARSTATEAMETELEPIWVSLRTFLATVKVRWRRDSRWVETAPTSRAMV